MRKGNCETCGKEFTTYRNNRRFCNTTCRVQAFRLKQKKQFSEQQQFEIFKIEFERFKESLLFDDPKTQEERVKQFWKGLIEMSAAVGGLTRWSDLVALFETCDILHSYRISKDEYEEITGKKKNVVAKTVDYARLTFLLSFIGFLGSIGFYFGVLREVYSPRQEKQEIRTLKAQNEDLQKTVNVLIEKEGK